MIRQFTATVYIVDNQKTLLIFHRKLKKWLPPGGHLELNELPSEAALREAKEETGLDVELIPQENVWVDESNAASFDRPFMCLLEKIPERPTEPAHEHIDFIYLGKPVRGSQIVYNPLETDGIRWFSLDDIESLESEVEIFEETKKTLRCILGQSKQLELVNANHGTYE